MNAELLYTSAPQGLKQGSRGFCTVLSTVGMPLNIATKLESLSGYRHLYPSGTPDAAKNPVSYSHLKLSVGGRMISVISRISDYGLDYSQRTNKLAHHIVVDAPLPNCGPAALLADPSVMRTQWDGNCINVPAPPALSAASVDPAPCSTWEAITGDAGWGGVLANAWLNPSSKPIFVVFSEDQSVQVLSLIEEAISLLPPAKRWQATFGTYVTNLPPDVDCKVRCVVSGSEEARMASARGVVINLTQASGPAPPSEAVTAARNGTIIGGHLSGPPSRVTVDRDGTQVGAPPIGEPIDYNADYNAEYNRHASATDFDPDNPFGSSAPDLPPSMRSKGTRSIPMFKGRGKGVKRNAKYILAGALTVTTILVIIGLVSFGKKLSDLAALSTLQPEIVKTEESLPDASKEEPVQKNGDASGEGGSKEEQKSSSHGSGIMPNPDGKESSIPTESRKTYLDPMKIKITLSQFFLQFGEGDKGKILLKAGIPNASLEATVRYEGEDNDRQETFGELMKEPGRCDWTWEESSDNGVNWSISEKRIGPTLIVQVEDKPKTVFCSILKIKNNGLFESTDEWVPVRSEVSASTADCVSIDIDINALLKSPKDAEVVAAFPDLFEPQYKIGFYGEGNVKTISSEKGDRIKFGRLQKLMAAEAQGDTVFDKCATSVAVLGSFKKTRNEIIELLRKSNNMFKAFCYKEDTPDAILKISMNLFSDGLNSLLSPGVGGQDVSEGYYSPIESERIVAWWIAHKERKFLEGVEQIKDPTQKSRARLHNEETKILSLLWIGEKQGGDGRSKEKLGFELIDDLVEYQKQFLKLRNELVGKEFISVIPNECIGVFSHRVSDASGVDGSLAQKSKSLGELHLWIKVKLVHQIASPGSAGAVGNPSSGPRSANPQSQQTK